MLGLDRIKIGARLFVLSGVAVGLLAACGVTGLVTLSRINDGAQRALVENALVVAAVDQARSAQVMFKKQVQEWKDILLRGNDPKNYDKYLALFKQEHASVLDLLARLRETLARLGFPTDALDQARQAHVALFERYQAALRDFDQADPGAGQKVDKGVVGIDREPTKAIDDIVADITSLATKMNRDAAAQAGELHSQARLFFLVGMVLAVALLCVLAAGIMGSILVPLRRNVAYAEAVGQGRLDAALEVTGSDEVAVLARAMRGMVESLKEKMLQTDAKSREAATQARKATEALETAAMEKSRAEEGRQALLDAAMQLEEVVRVVSAASEALAGQVDQASRGASAQAGRIGETATAMEEMNATVLQVARNASQASEMADMARSRATEGASVVTMLVTGIGEVRQNALGMKADMDGLGALIEGIGRILNVISDIADQTNLLALNAAIEAARAGEAGRGFAVVADEVRKLAEKTMDATKEVDQSIRAIQAGTRKNVENMDDAADRIEAATRQADASGGVLEAVVSFVNDTTEQVRSIATAAEEQSSTSEEINRSLADITRIASETSDTMGRAAKAVEDLSRQARVLEELIARMQRAQDSAAALA